MWIVSQLGARMHYAVPRILAAEGKLSRLFTDFYSAPWMRTVALGLPDGLIPEFCRRMIGRHSRGIPINCVTAFNVLGLAYSWRRRSGVDSTAVFLEFNRRFGDKVCASHWDPGAGVFTFNAAGLEVLQRAAKEGRRRVMEQTIAPSGLERSILASEHDLFPGWQDRRSDSAVEEYSKREEAEWKLADTILCGSQFVADGIEACGGPKERCIVVPYGVDSARQGLEELERFTKLRSGKLRVLMVGSVGLRKGIQYVWQAAGHLRDRAEFRVIGPQEINQATQQLLREQLDLRGSVPRSEITEHFEWADVFLLPSLCEGSATVTYEAQAVGLPIVCTPNTGSTVRDGIDGFVVPIRDVDAIVERLEWLMDPSLRRQFGIAAIANAENNSVTSYGLRLLVALSKPAHG